MSLARRFDEIVSGSQRGLSASVARGALQLLEKPYAGVIGLRNQYYDRSPSAVKRVKVPVISVGNLTMGGTGKTPVVAWLANYLSNQSVTPVIVSRGYGAPRGKKAPDTFQNDEAKELKWRLPNVAHVQNPDRVLAAQQAIEQHNADIILLDDGFQHRRLHRDLNIVLIDATQPFGYEHVFPRGTLREPMDALRRADLVILTRADRVDASVMKTIRDKATRICPHAAWCSSKHQATRLVNWKESKPIGYLANNRVAAFCAIGRPDAFRATLLECGYVLAGFRAFNDHYSFQNEDLIKLESWASSIGADALVCTQKDFVKLGTGTLGDTAVWALSIDIQFEDSRLLEEAALRLL